MAEEGIQQEQQLTFEQALARLEQIVSELESKQLPLEQSLSMVEEGIKLSNFCNKELGNAENRILKLTQNPDKSMSWTDLTQQFHQQ
ncbi:MAG: exodeoxyribonuclease VII small subunit [Victivallales bacterium]|nr:exodeoxyribonuclease VII small subunit [Victivallales bacterium]